MNNLALPDYRVESGIIYFSLTSDGTSGPAWIPRLVSKGFYVNEWSVSVLNSPSFQPCIPGVYQVAILPDTFCEESELTWENIHAEAVRRGWTKTGPEFGCLIREVISNKMMEAFMLCYIAVTHDPIEGYYLESSWRDGGKLTVITQGENPVTSRRWGRNRGYAFIVPDKSY